MKTHFKRFSKSTLAVVLSLCLLISCMTVGIIATDAAGITNSGKVGAAVDSESVGGATDYYYWNYQKNMPSGNYSASNHQALTQSLKATNKYYYIATLDTSSTYGMYMSYGGYGQNDKHFKPNSDFTAESNAAYKLSDKGVNNYGNTSNREKYTTNSSDTQYIVTWDSTQNELYMSPTSAGVELKWDVQTGHSTYYDLDHTETMTQAADGYTYTCDVSLTGGTAYYLFNKVGQYYYRGTSKLTTDSFVQVYSYGKDNFGGSADKISYTPATTGTYRFTWDNRDKTLSVALVGSANASYSLTGDIWSSCITQINGSTNTITRGEGVDDATWWGEYHAGAAVNTATGTAGVYTIDITTADRATLVAGNPTFTTIDIGLYKKNVGQKAFKVGDTYYNYIGGDYKVTSAGLTDADIVDLAASNGGGSLKLQPGRTYRITVNENSSKISVSCTSGDKYFLAGQYSDGTPQFFGGTWNTSNNELTYNSTSGCYEKTFTTNIPAGTINFKVVKNGDSDGWDGGAWPDGNTNQSYIINANATSVKFSFNPVTHETTVTQENSASGDATWPPTGINPVSYSGNDNTEIIYLFGPDATGLTNDNVSTLAPRVHVGNDYWVDLTNEISKTQNNRLYITITSKGRNSDGFYAGSGGSVDITHASGVASGGINSRHFDNNNSEKYFAYVAFDRPNNITHLGVLIHKDSSNNCIYTVYTTAQPPAPVTETQVVDICAKDATLRDDTFNRFARLATTTIDSSDAACFEYTDEDGVTYSSISAYNTAKDPDIVITRESYGGTDAGYTKMTNVPVGAKVKIKTTLSSNASAQGSFDNKAFKETHYVKGYSFNGVTYQINEWESDGVYEEIWTVRAVNTTYKDSNGVLQDATTGGKVVEVTPIYYMKDNTNCKTFYIDGYDGTVQNAWGNMLAVYPYYEGKSNKDNAFGGYPGQPMLLWGGKYQMEIPLTVDGTASGASVKGLTLHNAYWDLLHRSIDIRCNARNHAQTYDYDDFYKLYKEKNPDTIIFDFKYRTANDNFGDGYNYFNYEFAGTSGSEPTKAAAYYAESGKNGVEIVTDYFGRQVDVFGNLLTDAQKSDYDSTHPQGKELLIVSTGYKDTYVGEYATLWAVYAPQSSIPSGSGDTAGKFIGLISSSELYLNTWDNASKYPVSDHGLLMTDSRFENTYKHLKDYYTGVPALITYDREIWNDSKDKANRSDGKWYYSNKSDKISASIKIQYGAYSLYEAPDHSVSSDAWSDDPFNQNKTGVGGYNNIGTNTGCSAYFTNTTPNLNGKVASGEQFADSTKKFTFQAVPSGSYMFAGWVRYSNGKYYKITENEIGESPMSSNDVYIARFVTAKTGTLTVQHVVEQTDEYNGTGTPALTVTVKDGSGNNVSGSPFSVSDGSKIDISKWIDARNATYTIDISMTTTPSNESFMKNIASSSDNYAASPNTWNASYDKNNSSGADTEAQTANVASFTVQQILNSGITSLRYVSHLMKPVYTYQYEITYTYNSRFWGEQSYKVTGTFANDSEFSANTTGSKDTAKLNTDFIINKTPYEKTFRQQINWNYTDSAVTAAAGNTANHGASAMVNNAAGEPVTTNTYKMTAHVYASKTVNDKVTAEFVLPYKYNDKNSGYTVQDTDVYTAANGTKSGTSYLYDTGNESVTLTTQAYKLFTYDDLPHTGSDDTLASSLPLMEAAPYLMTNLGDNDYHYKLTDNMRYYTGNSFKIGDTTYYKSQDDVPQNPGTYKILTASDSVNFTKIKYAGTDHTTTYHFAVEDTSGGAKGQPGYKIYFFSYVTDDFGNYVDNEGHSVDSPIFNGQYCVYSVGREKDGIIEGKGSKKYFTRWDIYNTKGDYVASCYNRRFSYSGYDNYVVRPIYESDTENSYASSTGDGYKSQITFLDDSRNQWNNGASGSYHRVTGQTDLYAGDKIFTDFAITYNYNGLNLNLVPNAANNGADIKVGMIVERLDELDSVGTTKITGATYYADKYKSDNSWTAIKTALEDNSSLTTAVRNAGGTGHSCYHERIASNCSAANYQATLGGTPATGSTTSLMGFDTAVDNFNRLQWFYTINNSTQRTSDEATAKVTNMKNYAYRAISYIMVGNNAYLCSTPTYFTIYDTATRTGN